MTARNNNKLTDTLVKSTKPKDAPYKLSDGGGMYLLVKPNGGKYWHLAYRYNDKQKVLSLGVYPEVSLKDARLKREAAKKLLTKNIDPSEAKKEEKRLSILQAANTFEVIANEWLSKQVKLAPSTVKSYTRYLNYAFAAYSTHTDHLFLHGLTSLPITTDHSTSCIDQSKSYLKEALI